MNDFMCCTGVLLHCNGQGCATGHLKKLICVVLLQLISPDRSHVDSDNTFLKALNVLMMRVLANSQK